MGDPKLKLKILAHASSTMDQKINKRNRGQFNKYAGLKWP